MDAIMLDRKINSDSNNSKSKKKHTTNKKPKKKKISKLWDEFYVTKTGSNEYFSVRDEIFIHFKNLALAAAVRYYKHNLPYRSLVEFDDILQQANIGLLEAIASYEPWHNTVFQTWCYYRINGSIVDGLRVLQNFTRVVSKIRREIEPYLMRLRQILSRDPRLDELVEYFPTLSIGGVNIATIITNPLITASVFNQQENASGDGGNDGDRATIMDLCLEKNNKNKSVGVWDTSHRIEIIERVLSLLRNEEERQVINAYFFFGLTSPKIAAIFKMSQSKVCQKKHDGLLTLKIELRKHPEILMELGYHVKTNRNVES